MKPTLAASIALMFTLSGAFAEDAAKDKNLLQKTGESVEHGLQKTSETLKKAGDKAVDLVTTSEDEKRKDAKADALKKSTDQKADHMKNDAKADAMKKAADDKAEHIKNSGEKQ